ncbi:MAG TPA: hypothetical protein VN397_00010 [Candidatus Methylomirabilis sp.]|nr:hypothetical protein [Candidatus Methylomirabilis sp.]
MKTIRTILRRSSVWYGLVPAAMAVFYWFGLRAFAFPDGSWLRIPALPKVFFDQTMYLQVMAKDIIHGFNILPLPLRPFVWIAGKAWPGVTMSEYYALGVIASSVASLWLFAALVRRLGAGDVGVARSKALAAFLVVQAILVLRPGGPSWYVPFFLVALLLVWIGEGEWGRPPDGVDPERRRWAQGRLPVRAIGACVLAILLATVYPWYLAVIVATIGLLFLHRFIRARAVLPLLGAGLVVAGVMFIMRDRIVAAVSSSYSILLAVYGGIGWSHLTTLSNTVLVIVAWCAAWAIVTRRAWPQADAATKRTSLVLLAAWVGQMILWFQSLATGLSIVPDHFIYTVWLLSAISWAVWPGIASDRLPRLEKRIVLAIGIFASLFVGYIFFRLAVGTYAWPVFPSLIIHVGIWTFLAFAILQAVWRPKLERLALVAGVIYVAIGAWAVRASALEHAQIDRDMDGVRQWIARERPSAGLHWCSDVWSSDYLFSATGQDFHPAFSEKHDPFPITTLQNRLIEVASFFSPKQAGELYIWDDMMLHDLEFPCRAFVPAIRILDRLPLSKESKSFISGCDQSWADGERARVIAVMERRWSAPLPDSSALCDRFVVRRRLQNSWRIPLSYPLLYQDDAASVYGNR